VQVLCVLSTDMKMKMMMMMTMTMILVLPSKVLSVR
jgi:hypothetical protein